MPTDEELDAIMQAVENWTPEQWAAHRQAFVEATAGDCDGVFEEESE